MLLNVHDKNMEIIGILDNESQDAIGYSEDKWTRDLETGSSVYEFTAFNRKLSYETVYINPFNCLNIGNYVSFTYDGEDHVFKIMSVEKNGRETYCYCENLNLELRNEMVGAYDSGEDELTIEGHISKMRLLDYVNMTTGINELSNVKKAVSFSDEETKLSRLLALFQAFGAEHKFTTKLRSNGKVKEFRVDIYKKRDSNGNGGVGRFVKDKILRKGENIKSLKEKQDILEIFNMTVPKGKRKVTRVTQVIPLPKDKKPTVNSNEIIVRSNMINANGTLSIENIQTILKLCYEYRILPSGVISQLYLESFWGNSNVARVDNNWSGMTWTGNPNRPSGVVVSQGSARPSSEGGHYMHFASMADFFKDYFYLLAKQGIYNVANKTNISDYTRGLFRVGGAAYDYAAAGFDHYNSLMAGIRNGINAKNSNVLDTYDNDWKNPKVVTSTTVEQPGAPNTKKALTELGSLVGKTVGNGQCYAVSAWFSYKLNGAGLGCGLGSFSGLVGSGIRACDIGTDYNWGSFGWGVEGSGFSNKNIVAGTILNIKPNYGAPWYTGYYGHTVVVESVNGDTVTVLQQNYAGKQYVTRDNYSLSAIIPSIQTLVHPSELAKGGRVDGGNAVVKVDSVDKYVNVDLPTEVETKEETEEFFIPDGYNKKWYDDDGNLEFYIDGLAIYAPQSAANFPVAFFKNDNADKWIRRDFEYEVDTVDELVEKSLEDLKKNCYPTLDYEIDGFFNASIGDTYLIEDDDFEPKLTIKARVISQEISHTQPENNKTELSNYVKLKSAVPDALTSRLQQLIYTSVPYEIRVSASNGTSFKNNEGESELTVELLKSGITQEAEFFFKNGDSLVGKGTKLLVKATDFEHVFNLTIEAYVNNELVATKPITFTDVNDGDDGVGVESIDRYFTSSDQSDGVTIEGAEWSDKPPAPTEDGKYLWAYDKITYTDGTVTTTKPSAVGANFDVDAFRAEIAEDLKDVPNREEFENKIAEELANSKAEIETQIESAKTQAESNAKEYADTINQETAKVAELANAAAGEIKADLVNVKNNLTATSLVANNAQAAVDAAKQELAEVNTKVDNAKAELTQTKQQLTTVSDDLSKAKTDFQNAVSAVDTKATNLKNDLTQAKQDLASQAQQLQEQAGAQSELTNSVSSVEKTANGTKTTVSELSKTVAQNGKDITSVTNRTKTVEDDLANTKTTLTQVQTTANSASQKTATLESGLDGLSAKFENLSVGATNHFLDSAFETTIQKIGILQNGNVYTPSIDTTEKCDGYNTLKIVCEDSAGVDNPKITYRALAKLKTVQQGKLPDVVTISFWGKTDTKGMGLYTRLGYMGYVDSQNVTLTTDWKRYIVHVKTSSVASNEWTFKLSKAGTVWIAKPQFEFSAIASDYHSAEEDTSSKVAEYKQNADQNYASLQTTVQNLDGTVQHNKTVAEQTAQGFKTRIESLETYKDGESTRANAYFESAKTETAKQLTAERTAIANNYVAKSTYTSDVSGIRNELSATTSTANATKTNLANYQASNDKMVASLKSSLQTTDGNVSNLQTKVEAVPGQITSAVSAVEGKIPTSAGGRNLILDTSADWSSGWTSFNGQNNQTRTIYRIYNRGLKVGDKVNVRLVLKYSDIVAADGQTAKISTQCPGNVTAWGAGGLNSGQGVYLSTGDNEVVLSGTTTITDNHLRNEYWSWQLRVDYVASGRIQWKEAKAEAGDLPTPWSPAPEDTTEQISNLSSQIQQTADGITLLATKTELSSAKNELQSGINTATNKANNAQSTANSNAQTISTHTTQISALNTGLQAKVSQTDFNILSGRVTTAENNITAKANELSSKITSVEGKIPTNIGTVNLIKQSTAQKGYRLASDAGPFQDSNHMLSDWIKIEPSTVYTLTTYENVNENNNYYSLGWYSTNNADYSGKISRPTGAATAADLKGGKQYKSPANAKYAKVSYPTKYAKVKFERGNIATDYNPNPDDYDAALTKAQSEFKQTTDAIKASVSSLDSSTVKSSSLTINADGIVMKAGKSTTDVANAIGSYFAVNQNAINLFSDKINVKGNMIVNGAITSDKIASKSINTSHLNGKIITADVISSNAVTAGAIKAGAVTTDKMSANSINGDRIAAGTLDAAKIKAGSITASQIASGTITSNQIKAGGISSANIASGAITSDKIAANSIDASKIAANAITANMIRGGQLNSTNGATVFDLNAGTLTFNNNYGYIQRVASDKIFEITTYLSTASDSQEHLTSAFNIRKSDNSRQAGVKFTLYNTVEDKPTAEAKINADALILYDSKNTRLFSVHGKSTFAGGVNFQGWGDIPIAKVHGGLVVNDIGIGSHTKSLLKIVEELCKKAGILWV